MYTQREVLEKLYDLYPSFKIEFETFLKEDWVDEEVSGCTIFNRFFDSILPLANSMQSSDKESLFQLIEDCVKNGDQDIKIGVCTCFIENLINIAGNKDNTYNLQYSHFVPYLGPESREYARAWDRLNGVKTPGIDD